MKRSSSKVRHSLSFEPNLSDCNKDLKKSKLTETPNAREYLQLALAKILEMQRHMKEDSPFDTTSDLGDSENEEETMKEVLIKVFKDLPGSPHSTASIIEKAMQPSDPRIRAIRGQSIQLAGYDTCRRVALDFMKHVVKFSTTAQNHNNQQSSVQESQVKMAAAASREIDSVLEPPTNKSFSNHEIRMRMLTSLDLHLAVKQRDYIAKLMSQQNV